MIPDLSNPQGWNRYSYVTNRPINFSDPTGHKACGDEEDIDCNGKLKRAITTKADCSGSACRGGDNKDKQTDTTEDAETTVEDLLLSNPKFDPFVCKYSSESDCVYPGSDMEKVDLAFLELYQDHGIDLDYYALRGLPNPLRIDQVPTELQWTLPGNGSYAISLFFKELENEGGNRLWGVRGDQQHFGQDMLNYEPNYVFHLMLAHPLTLARTIEIVNNMPPGQYEQFNNTSPAGP